MSGFLVIIEGTRHKSWYLAVAITGIDFLSVTANTGRTECPDCPEGGLRNFIFAPYNNRDRSSSQLIKDFFS
jgi:hypothetical protein